MLLAVDESGERVCEAELHRLRGDLLRQRGVIEEAGHEFCRAVEIARSQKARGWELRAATSLAQLHADRGNEAKAIRHPLPGLFPVYRELRYSGPVCG
jgi:predicted ATPase